MTDVVVADARPYVQYACDGVQTVFTFPFPVLAAADLIVEIDDGTTPAGVQVSGIGDSAGGTVTLALPPEAGRRLTLYRDMPVERTTDFQEAGAFRASAINAELDRLAMLTQQVELLATQALRRTPGDSDIAMLLPDAQTRAGMALAFDAAGAPALVAPSGTPETETTRQRRADLQAVRARLAGTAPRASGKPAAAMDLRLHAGLDLVATERASDGTATDAAGRLLTIPANTPRFDYDRVTGAPLGLLCEGRRLNFLRNSLSPAGQSLWLSAGSFTLSVRGPGSCSVSGNFSGTAYENAPLTFVLSATSLVAFTVAGSLSGFQCESGGSATSLIPSPSDKAGVREAESTTLTDMRWLTPGRGFSLIVEASLPDVPSSGVLRLLSLDDGTEHNRHELNYAASLPQLALVSKAEGVSQGDIVGLTGGWADGAAHTIGITIGNGTRALYVDGVKAGSDTLSEPVGATNLRIGRDYAGSAWQGHVRRVVAFPGPLPDADMTALTA